MRDGDAAWRFRFIESSLGRCNGTRNASLLRVSLVSSPPARLSSALSSSRAHLPHAPHLHTATDERATPADRFPSGSKQTRVDDGDDDDDNGTRIFVSWTPALVFFFSFFLRRLPLGSASASRFFEASIEPTPLPTRNLRGGPRRVFKLFASPGEIRREKPSVCSANPGRTVLYYPAPGAPERSTVCNRGRIEEERFFSGKINANFDSRKNFFSKDVRGNAVALDLCVERGLVNREGCSATFLRVFANGLSITVN